MKLTKYTHSCLLAETAEAVTLFDPGNFSWESGCFDINKLTRLDEIVVTHEHPDHYHLPFMQALKEKFPAATVVAPPSLAAQLKSIGVTHVTHESTPHTEIFSNGPHAPVTLPGNIVEHNALHFRDRLTVTGDRHDIESTKEIIAYAMVAPWGSVMSGVSMLVQLRPKIILPLHDWHWKDEARLAMYDRLEVFFNDQGIRFLKPVDAVPIEV